MFKYYAIIMYFSSPYMNKEKIEISVDGQWIQYIFLYIFQKMFKYWWGLKRDIIFYTIYMVVVVQE